MFPPPHLFHQPASTFITSHLPHQPTPPQLIPSPNPLSIAHFIFWREKPNQGLGWICDRIDGWDLVKGQQEALWDSQFGPGSHVGEDMYYFYFVINIVAQVSH